MNSAYDRSVVFPTELGKSTSKQLEGSSPTVVVPLGSTEQHGPHLPLDTDARIATAVARAVVTSLRATGYPAPLVIAPAVAYGASGEHQGFAGTVSIGTAVLERLLVEFGRSACEWAQRLVFVNGHGGNVDALTASVARLQDEGQGRRVVPVLRIRRGCPRRSYRNCDTAASFTRNRAHGPPPGG
jgi:mycofactocin system creatininase family protein